MDFLWPHHLWLLLALPLLAALGPWLARRRDPQALLARLRHVGPAPARGWRRRLPGTLWLLALALLLLALARPTARVALPWARSTLVLALDVSLSMRVDDVKPTRMQAAQEAARAFLRDLPAHVEVALVTFAGSAQVVQPATADRAAVIGAIDAIQMQIGTALGSAIALALAELFPDHGIDLTELTFGPQFARSLDDKPRRPARQVDPVPAGSYDAAAIILLSDGRRTTGVDTLLAAKMAADRGVRIHVIGLGTPDGHASAGEGMAIYLQLDEPTLREVARLTGGEYHHAGTAEALRGVYRTLGSRAEMRTRETELTAALSLLAALLLVGGASLSLLWHGRV